MFNFIKNNNILYERDYNKYKLMIILLIKLVYTTKISHSNIIVQRLYSLSLKFTMT